MKKLFTIILVISIVISCAKKGKNNNKNINVSLLLIIKQDSNLVTIKDPIICKDTSKNFFAIRIGVPTSKIALIKNKEINYIALALGKDTLINSKGSDYNYSNRCPDSNTFFISDNKGTKIFGKKRNNIFWFYITRCMGKNNDLIKLKRFVIQTDTCYNF